MVRTRLVLWVGLALMGAPTLPAAAAPINFSSFNEESYPSGTTPSWILTGTPTGAAVQMQNDSGPWIFYDAQDVFSHELSFTIRTTSAENDYFGFVLGFGAGDTTSSTANFLLVDWKRGTQNHDWTFGTSAATAGGSAERGLAISRVTGVPTLDEMWRHVNSLADSGGAVQEIQEAFTRGNSGFFANVDYDFVVRVYQQQVRVWVNETLELDITDPFLSGGFGVYNWSQPSTTYSDLEMAPVPEPASLALLGAGLSAAAVRMRRRRAVATR